MIYSVGNYYGIPTGQSYTVDAFIPLWNVIPGVRQNEVVGNQIDVRHFIMKFVMEHNASAGLTISPYEVKVTLIRTNVLLANTPGTQNIPGANIPLNFWVSGGSGYPEIRTWNSNIVRVLQEKRYRLSIGGGITAAAEQFKVCRAKLHRLRGKKTFMTDWGGNVAGVDGRVREGYYYVIVQQYTGNVSSATNNLGVSINYNLYYKDF